MADAIFFMPHKSAGSPYINHFLQPDTIIPDGANPQAFNRYAYVMNSPIGYNDPSGHSEDCGIGMGCVSSYERSHNSGQRAHKKDQGREHDNGDNRKNKGDDSVYDILGYQPPIFKTLHPLNGNTINQEPIYDYTKTPAELIGYRVISYAYDDVHFSPRDFFVPSDPITFSSTFVDAYKFGINGVSFRGIVLIRGIAGVSNASAAIPFVGEALSTLALVDSLNSATTFDTHLRVHTIHFPKPLLEDYKISLLK